MKPAPDFCLEDQDGTTHSLSDYQGLWLIIYFYPKDETPACTKEACAFRDGREFLESMGAKVVGISKDSVKSHRRFAKRHKLSFTLLSDSSADVIKAYGAWGKKKLMGREFEGILRNTYLVNPDGMIHKSYVGVDPKSHFAELALDLKNARSATN